MWRYRPQWCRQKHVDCDHGRLLAAPFGHGAVSRTQWFEAVPIPAGEDRNGVVRNRARCLAPPCQREPELDSSARCEYIRKITSVFPQLDERLDRPCRVSSSGESSRAGLGRALIQRPGALLIDEMSWRLSPRKWEASPTECSMPHASTGTAVMLVESKTQILPLERGRASSGAGAVFSRHQRQAEKK